MLWPTLMAGKWPISARRRSSTMWPSTKERTASVIGSSRSSPSTRTVSMPVMLPCGGVAHALDDNWPGAERRTACSCVRWGVRRGRCRSGAGPWRAGSGCPPSAARACRWRRNESAMASAIWAARTRISGGSSQVATTTTDLLRPAPRQSSMNGLHLAAAFADEGDDVDLGVGALGDFAEQACSCRRRCRRRCRCVGRGRRSSGRRWRAWLVMKTSRTRVRRRGEGAANSRVRNRQRLQAGRDRRWAGRCRR